MSLEGPYVQRSTDGFSNAFRDGEVDQQALWELVEFQIQGGVDVLVPCGTTGESATLTNSEQDQVIKIVVQQARRRVPVVAGTGSNSTADSDFAFMRRDTNWSAIIDRGVARS